MTWSDSGGAPRAVPETAHDADRVAADPEIVTYQEALESAEHARTFACEAHLRQRNLEGIFHALIYIGDCLAAVATKEDKP